LANLVKLPGILTSMTRTFTIGEAKTNLSKLVALAEQGESVELCRGRQPVARLVPLPKSSAARRKPGALAGRIHLAEDFDAWPADLARALGVEG